MAPPGSRVPVPRDPRLPRTARATMVSRAKGRQQPWHCGDPAAWLEGRHPGWSPALICVALQTPPCTPLSGACLSLLALCIQGCPRPTSIAEGSRHCQALLEAQVCWLFTAGLSSRCRSRVVYVQPSGGNKVPLRAGGGAGREEFSLKSERAGQSCKYSANVIYSSVLAKSQPLADQNYKVPPLKPNLYSTFFPPSIFGRP